MDVESLRVFATRYTSAWCSQDAARVASHFAERGSLTINDGAPSVGRGAIAAAAQEFMTAFPDMVVRMDGVTVDGRHAVYKWTLTGTNTGPGGTRQAVRISGYEEWTICREGLIEDSKGTSTRRTTDASCSPAAASTRVIPERRVPCIRDTNVAPRGGVYISRLATRIRMRSQNRSTGMRTDIVVPLPGVDSMVSRAPSRWALVRMLSRP